MPLAVCRPYGIYHIVIIRITTKNTPLFVSFGLKSSRRVCSAHTHSHIHTHNYAHTPRSRRTRAPQWCVNVK